jgi:hypothetical protein
MRIQSVFLLVVAVVLAVVGVDAAAGQEPAGTAGAPGLEALEQAAHENLLDLLTIAAQMREKRREMRGSLIGLAEATPKQQKAVYDWAQRIRDQGDMQALSLLTDDQRRMIDRLQGPKIELPLRGLPQRKT